MPKPKPNPKPRPQWWPLVATVAIAVAFTAWQMAERTEQIIYLRDPATYLQVAYWIAHHGYLPIPDSVAAFGGPHPGLSFASSNYYPRGTGIVPQFMTGTPLVLAAGIWLHGIKAALLVTPLIGGCAVLSFGGLAGRLAGPGWAPAAAAVLALSLPEQYTSRGTFSEPLAQVLMFGGLCLLADSLTVNRNPGKKPDWPGQDKVLAALAGLALGLTILVRIDGLSDILPAVPFLGVLLAARRRQAVPFGVALVVGVGYGLADGYLKSRPYLDLEAPSLRPLGYIVAITDRGHGERHRDHRQPESTKRRQKGPRHQDRAVPARRGRGPDRTNLRRLRRQAPRPDRGGGDRPDLDRLRGRTPEAGRPARQRPPAVLRGQPVLGDLVPRRPRRAAGRVRPGRPGQEMPRRRC